MDKQFLPIPHLCVAAQEGHEAVEQLARLHDAGLDDGGTCGGITDQN